MKLEIFSRKRGHRDPCEIKKTSAGWYIEFNPDGGKDCDKAGNPQLFKYLNHNSVNFPNALGGYLICLWERSEEKQLTDFEIQEQLNLLSDWIETVEQSSPKGIWAWPPYK